MIHDAKLESALRPAAPRLLGHFVLVVPVLGPSRALLTPALVLAGW